MQPQGCAIRVVARAMRFAPYARLDSVWAREGRHAYIWLRVITLAEGKTLHNAFPDRSFKRGGP
jgi:hypothetical protein